MAQMTFSVYDATEMINDLDNCNTVLEAENDNIQNAFASLNETFKDEYYNEYKEAFEEGNVLTKMMMQETVGLMQKLIAYAARIRDEK